MSSTLKSRKAEEQRRLETAQAVLREHSRRVRPPEGPEAIADETEVILPYAARRKEDWRPNLKSRDVRNIRLSLARHLYARYPVGRHLEHVWFEDPVRIRRAADQPEVARDVGLRRRWYAIAASGASLHREEAHVWFNRKECHRFLTAPRGLTFAEAFVHAYASGHTDDIGIVGRLARSKLSQQDFRGPFWREAVRFFCLEPAPLPVVNDLVDYLRRGLRDRDAFSFKGKTLASLVRGMELWHRELALLKRLGDRRWEGHAVEDSVWTVENRGEKPVQWSISQILDSKTLGREGSAMHHCVYSYQEKCISGACSIWSLRRGGERALTVEMDADGRLVQVRGYANRLARPEETKVLRAWASENGLAFR